MFGPQSVEVRFGLRYPIRQGVLLGDGAYGPLSEQIPGGVLRMPEPLQMLQDIFRRRKHGDQQM